jgi:hypothetical protein
MFDLSWPSEAGQENDPFISAPRKRRRSDALKLSADEAKAVRIAVRKLARAFGGFVRLGVMLDMPSATVRRIANPKGIAPTGTFAIRLAAVAKVPVEVLLGGKVVVTLPIIGRAA